MSEDHSELQAEGLAGAPEGGDEPFIIEALHGVDRERALQAAVVRDYLVTLRGGAPFLSSTDGRLLLRWLDGGIPVVVILAALDRAADRRLKRRAKRPLSLQACRAELKSAPAPKAQAASSGADALLLYMGQLGLMAVEPRYEALKQRLISALQTLAFLPQEPEERATHGVVLVREFHEGVWMATEERSVLRAAVAAGFDGLRGSLPALLIEGLVEEATRDTLRRRFPLVSARELWDRLQGAPATASADL